MSLVAYSCILLWIVGWMYLYYFTDKKDKLSFYSLASVETNKWRLVILILLLWSPFMLVNFIDLSDESDHFSRVKYQTENGRYDRAVVAYEVAIDKFPKSNLLHVKYMTYLNSMGAYEPLTDLASKYEKVKKETKNEDLASNLNALQKIGYLISGLDGFSNYDKNLEAKDADLEKFAKALTLDIHGKRKQALTEYTNLAKSASNYASVIMPRVYAIYFNSSKLDLDDLVYNETFFPFLSFSQKNEVYWNNGSYGWYFKNILHREFLSGDLMAWLAVLFSSVTWFLFFGRILFVKLKELKFLLLVIALSLLVNTLVYPFTEWITTFFEYVNIPLKYPGFLYSVFAIGLVEEMVKFLSWFIIYRLFSKRFKYPNQIISLAVASAIGFALIENLIYINTQDLHLIFIRSTVCLGIHAGCSAIVSYCYIKAKTSRWKISPTISILTGIMVSSLLHGTYDYFIFNQQLYLYVALFLLTMHLFIFSINNSLNISNINLKSTIRLVQSSWFILIFGTIAIFLIQYMLIGKRYGALEANLMLKSNYVLAILCLTYFYYMFSKIELSAYTVLPLRYAIPGYEVFSKKGSSNLDGYLDKNLKLFAQKSNGAISHFFPLEVTIKNPINVQGDYEWRVVEFIEPFNYTGLNSSYALIRPKSNNHELFMDKIEVVMLFVPMHVLLNESREYNSSEFRFIGRIFSRPTHQDIKIS